MATNSSMLGAYTYATESSFCEDVDTVASRMPALGAPDLSGFVQQSVAPGIMKQRASDGFHHIPGPQEGTITTEFLLTGAGASVAGALPSQTEFSKILGYVLGNSAATGAGTTLTGSTDADTWASTTSDDLAAGEIVRLGALGDGDGEGQAYAISSVSGTAVESLVAAEGAPANGAVVYGGYMHYPSEATPTFSSIRMQAHTKNEQVLAHGMYPTGINITGLNPGEQPKVSVPWAASAWEYKSGTFPVSAAHETASGLTVAAGSFFINDVGTTTRNTESIREFNLNIDYQITPLPGPGGAFAYQRFVDARLTSIMASFDIVVDAEDSGTRTWQDYWDTDPNSRAYKHALYTLNTRDGASAAFYFPKVTLASPPQYIDFNGLNAVRLSFKALTGGTTTNDLTSSSFRIYLG